MKNLISVYVFLSVIITINSKSTNLLDEQIFLIYDKGTTVYLYNLTVFTTSNWNNKFKSINGKFYIGINFDTDFNGNNLIKLDHKSNLIKFNESYNLLFTSKYPLESMKNIHIQLNSNDLINDNFIYLDLIVIQLITERVPIPTRIFCGFNNQPFRVESGQITSIVECKNGQLNKLSWINLLNPSKININYVPMKH